MHLRRKMNRLRVSSYVQKNAEKKQQQWGIRDEMKNNLRPPFSEVHGGSRSYSEAMIKRVIKRPRRLN